MGNNLPAKKYKIGERTERYLQFSLSHTGSSTDSHFIDLAAALSAVNKRFYRQGLYYYIKSISVVETTADSKVQFGTAPDTWHIPQAWRLGKRNWDKMNELAAGGTTGLDQITGSYHDFKIYLNANHRTDPDVTVPDNGPESMDGSPDYDNEEWVYSKINSLFPAHTAANTAQASNNADRDTFDIMLLGTSHVAGAGAEYEYAAISLCKSYLAQKAIIRSDVPYQFDDLGDDPLLRIFDTTDNLRDTVDDLQDDNDSPPYNNDATYADTIMRAQCSVGPTSTKMASLPGFVVPFGLLEVLTTASGGGGDNTVKIMIEMAPGPYHGVYAERLE
jgi:hypothetical protein